VKYEIVEKKKSSGDPSDWNVQPAGAGKGSGRTATVYGRYGRDAKRMAEIIAKALEVEA
jgi:hypothetical protein